MSRVLAMVSDRPSSWFKGWMLRRWLRDAAPDVVILDDGLGERIVKSISPSPLVIVRPNREPPDTAGLEPPPSRGTDLALGGGLESVDPSGLPTWTYLADQPRLAALAVEARAKTRVRFGIERDELLLVGWGSDPWLDGASLFIRTLWYLHHRYETQAHGLWVGLDPGSDASTELEREVDRCGLGEYMHFQPVDDEPTRWSGDAIFLPCRLELDLGQVVDALAAGSAVVSFAPPVLAHPSLLTVAPLDLDEAARTLTGALREDPQSRVADSVRLDVGSWVSNFIDVLDDHKG